jgi:hypothetical protein
MRWPGKSGGLSNYETWQRSRSVRGVEPSSRPAGWRIVPSDDVREGSPRRAAEPRGEASRREPVFAGESPPWPSVGTLIHLLLER